MAGLFAAAATVLLTPELSAQSEAASTSEAAPTARARMVLEGRVATTVPVTLLSNGPRFALRPIAAALGVELRVGPLGESHTLIFEDRQIIVGPDQALMVTVSPDGTQQREITRLGRIPIRTTAGLEVSLDLLDRALGEPLNYRFVWAMDRLELEVSRPELRHLQGSINLVHQYPVSFVEIEFSAPPRYRVERPPGALEIRLIGDRLAVPLRVPRVDDPLVTNVLVTADGVRLELAENAIADEPRLLQSPRARLVIEVVETTDAQNVASTAPRRAAPRAPGIRTIVLDPGHGGSETGAIGPSGTAEAELNLLVGRALKLQLERRLPVKVLLTRTEDVDIPLETRAAIANENRADLFISLHFNSSFGPSAHGA
ncbi:MAG: N-acetylmuramoyl-L-alanine amidase, partial [Acidobacteriota bacterium]